MKEKIVLVTQEVWDQIKETIPLGRLPYMPDLLSAKVILAPDEVIEICPVLKEFGIYLIIGVDIALELYRKAGKHVPRSLFEHK